MPIFFSHVEFVQEEDGSQTGSCHLISFPSVSPDRVFVASALVHQLDFFGPCDWFACHKSCKLEDRYLLLDVVAQLIWLKTLLGQKCSPDVQKAAGLTLCLQLSAKNYVLLNLPHVWIETCGEMCAPCDITEGWFYFYFWDSGLLLEDTAELNLAEYNGFFLKHKNKKKSLCY